MCESDTDSSSSDLTVVGSPIINELDCDVDMDTGEDDDKSHTAEVDPADSSISIASTAPSTSERTRKKGGRWDQTTLKTDEATPTTESSTASTSTTAPTDEMQLNTGKKRKPSPADGVPQPKRRTTPKDGIQQLAAKKRKSSPAEGLPQQTSKKRTSAPTEEETSQQPLTPTTPAPMTPRCLPSPPKRKRSPTPSFGGEDTTEPKKKWIWNPRDYYGHAPPYMIDIGGYRVHLQSWWQLYKSAQYGSYYFRNNYGESVWPAKY